MAKAVGLFDDVSACDLEFLRKRTEERAHWDRIFLLGFSHKMPYSACIMEPLFILLSLGLSSFATADQNAEVQCNIKNYKDFIKKPGIHNCNLQGADLWMRYLRGANLQGADLTGANLPFADLEEADLQVAILHGAENLKTVDFRGANLRGTKVTPSQAEYLTAQGLSGFVVVE